MELPDRVVNSQWCLVPFFGHSHHIQNSHSKAFFLCFMSNRHLYPSIQKIISPLKNKDANKHFKIVDMLFNNKYVFIFKDSTLLNEPFFPPVNCIHSYWISGTITLRNRSQNISFSNLDNVYMWKILLHTLSAQNEKSH